MAWCLIMHRDNFTFTSSPNILGQFTEGE